MLPMPSNRPSLRAFRSLWNAVASVAAALAVATVTPVTMAETAGPAPQGDTNDVTAPPQQQPVAPQAPPPAAPDAQAPSIAVVAPVTTPAAPPAQQDSNTPSDEYADNDPSALSDFREPLAPYGQWTNDPTYGTIWVPDSAQVGTDFAPYQTAGSWGMADTGDWMWQSDYSWGYIPFHYGRWVWAGSYWGWIPGRRYAPAWVTWRVGEGGYVGWAPLPPAWYWRGGMSVGLWSRPYAAYCFVPTQYAFSRNVSGYVVRDRGRVQSIAAGTRAYHPAMPTAGRVGPGRDARMSPSLADAHIPASAAPRRFASRDARATAYATRSSTAAARASSGYNGFGMRTGAQPASRASAWQGSYSRWNSGQAPALHTPPSRAYPATSRAYPAYHPSAPGYYRGGGQHVAPRPSYRAPSSGGSQWSAPRFSGGRSGGRRR